MSQQSALFTAPERSVITIGGTEGGRAVAMQFPMWGKGAPLYFWAEKGMVCWEDTREDCKPDQKYGSMTWRDAGIRVRNLNDLVFRSTEKGYYRDEMNRLKQFLTEMKNVIQTAKEQGGPFDGDDVLRALARRRPTTVIAPQIVDLD